MKAVFSKLQDVCNSVEFTLLYVLDPVGIQAQVMRILLWTLYVRLAIMKIESLGSIFAEKFDPAGLQLLWQIIIKSAKKAHVQGDQF